MVIPRRAASLWRGLVAERPRLADTARPVAAIENDNRDLSHFGTV